MRLLEPIYGNTILCVRASANFSKMPNSKNPFMDKDNSVVMLQTIISFCQATDSIRFWHILLLNVCKDTAVTNAETRVTSYDDYLPQYTEQEKIAIARHHH